MPAPLRAPFPGRVVASLALVAGCTAPHPEPAAPPPLAIETDHFPGNVRSGPVPASMDRTVDAAPRVASTPSAPRAWPLEVRLGYARALPPAGSPVAGLARQVFVDRSASPLRPRSELSRGVLLADSAAEPGRLEWETRRLIALLPGATSVVHTRPNDALEGAPLPPWRSFDVEVSRPGDGTDALELALRFEGWVTPAPPDEDDEEDSGTAPDPVPELCEERLLLDVAPAPGEPLRLMLPAPARGAPMGGFVCDLAVLDVDRGDALAFDTAVDRAEADLDRARRVAALRAGFPTGDESRVLASESALHALDRVELQRSSLVFLSRATGAPFTGDLALVASDDTLAAWADALRQEVRALPASSAPRSLGWELESATYRWLALRADERDGGLPPEVAGLLLRRAGELGRYPDLLAEAVAESRSVEELGDRIEHENRIFLEDAHPAARVRAYDWLVARGADLGAFDPLAPRAGRRAALDALEAAEDPSDAEGTP